MPEQMTLNAAAAAFLRETRAARGMSLTQVAERSGIPHVSVQRYLAESRVMPIEKFAAICEALDVDVVTGVAAAWRMRHAG